MRKVLMGIPIMTFLANFAILLDIPILREIIVFIFLSFIPGFAILRLFKLKEISFLYTILFSVGLSIAFVMFLGLLVNELYLFLGLSRPLSTIPIMVAISAFTLAVFFVEYRRNLTETLKQKTSFEGNLKNVYPVSIILFLLPLLSAIGVLYLNVYVILFSCAVIAFLCVISVVSKRIVPENLYPFLIFSISIALVCQVILTSKYITGWDINHEYYVFSLTQMNGHWSSLNANVNLLIDQTYNSMLSITLLPVVYSVLMQAPGEIVFKMLYPFIFCLVPLTMYKICEKQFGKLIGLLSAFFFVFTSVAFYGEPLGISRQIVGELFFILSVSLLINNKIPLTKRRLLLIIFGAALLVSHYALAYIYLIIVALVFMVSRLKHKIGGTLNTLTVLSLFAMTFSWFALTIAPLEFLISDIKWIFSGLAAGVFPTSTLTASFAFSISQGSIVVSWINHLLAGITTLFLIIGVLALTLRPKGSGVFEPYRVIIIAASIILAIAFIPNIATTLNFTRFYGITLLVLSPCFVLGGQALLKIIKETWLKIKRPLKRQVVSKGKNINIVFLIIAILLSAYFLSQVGFINRVTGSEIHTYNVDFDRMITSNDSLIKLGLYGNYLPEQDVISASWLSNHKGETAEVFADERCGIQVLASYGLFPGAYINQIEKITIPPQGSFVYLGSLNIVNEVITTTLSAAGSFNTSELSPLLNQNNLVYSNGHSAVWYITLTQ